MEDFRQLVQSDEGARAWKPQIPAVYSAFYDRLAAGGPLGPGLAKGVSASTAKAHLGRCLPFNAEPPKGERELGFADSRADTLGRFLDVDSTIAALRRAAHPR